MKKTKHGDYESVVTFETWSNFKVHIVFTDDLAESRIARYETAGVAGEYGTEALFTRGAGGYGHLFFQRDACARVIAHEVWHAIWWMFQWAGVKDWDNETTAYHLGYLVGKVSEFQAKVLEVKSGKKEAPYEWSSSQRVVRAVQGVSSRFNDSGEEGLGEKSIPTETGGSDSGRCCP